ncbi:MAG: amino acid adenylation domain-containing protein, partial [bacterium]|nr:amino acid adenylation domain-containing protein [bacterium]
MMVRNIIEDLQKKNIFIECLNGTLKITGKSNLDDELLKLIKENKKSIINFLEMDGKMKTPSDFTYSDFNLTEYNKILSDNNIDSYEVHDVYNLTPMQYGFLFHSMIEKESSVYIEQTSLEIKSKIDLKEFEKAWLHLSQKYDVFRTLFITDFKTPIQIILKDRPLEFSYIDIRKEINKKDTLAKIKKMDLNNLFNLKSDPLFRIIVVQLDEEEYLIIITYHHIIFDGWSLAILFSEFLTCYDKLINNQKIIFEKPPEYSTYINWLNKRNKDEAKGYWSKYLLGYKKLATIPSDNTIDYCGDEEQLVHNWSLDEYQTDKLNLLSGEMRTTLNVVLQAIWGIILSIYNQTEDVVFGSVVSGRPEEIPRVEEIIGLFINSVPVRVKFSKDDTFIDVINNIQNSALESLKYHYYSLAEIQSLSGLNNKLLDHLIVVENYPEDENSNSSLVVDNMDIFEQINYDFGITVIPAKEIGFKFHYNPCRFNENTVKRIVSHFKNLVSSIIIDPGSKIKYLKVIPDKEKALIVEGFNDTKKELSKDKTLINLFEDQVEINPDKIALIYNEKKITYRELHEKASRLAFELQKNGACPGQIVGLSSKISHDFVIGIIAILKTGAAYCPLNPDDPAERLTQMISECKIKIILFDSVLTEKIDYHLTSVIVDQDYKVGLKGNWGGINDLAYVIYTSGSSGKPKGVMIENRNIVNQIDGLRKRYSSLIGSKHILLTPATFDPSVQQIFWPFTLGGELHLVDNGIKTNSQKLLQYIVKEKIDVVNTVPSLMNLLTDSSSDYVELRFKMIILAGEIFSKQLYKKIINSFQVEKLINIYGPTEATINTTLYECGEEENCKTIPIGQPLMNYQIWILGKDKEILPIGVPGEIYISGVGIARGYIGQTELTEKKFIPCPYRDGEVMYRSGDIGRWLPEGNIEFVGRDDFQIKLKGFRIELGEIEKNLLQHVKINSVVVTVKISLYDEKQLVAYFISEDDLKVSEIRNFLRNTIPEYMIPSYFIQMESFPLTLNGKIDIKALPEPEEVAVNTGVKYISPHSEIEKILAKIWKDVLRSNIEIGID